MFENIRTGNRFFDNMLVDAMKQSNRNKETIKMKDKTVYQVTNDKLIAALNRKGSYAVALTPKQTNIFGKEPKKKKVFIVEESGHPDHISRTIRQHEVGHFVHNHTGVLRKIKDEFEADSYMAKTCGKRDALKALGYIQLTCKQPIMSYPRLEVLARQAKILFSKEV